MGNKIGSFLVTLATFAAVAAAQPAKPIKSTQRGQSMVTGTISWSKTYGVVPEGPRSSRAAVNPCGDFYVAATVPSTGKAIKTTAEMTLVSSGGYYYTPHYYHCSYKLVGLPTNTPLYIIAGLGGALLLPQIDENPMYLTDAWIGGRYNKPPPGAFRTFTDNQSVNLKPQGPTAVVDFEMTYARKDNPKSFEPNQEEV